MIINVEKVFVVIHPHHLTKVSLQLSPKDVMSKEMIEPSLDFQLKGDCHWRDWAIRNLPEGMIIEIVDVQRGINSCYRIKGDEFRCHKWTRISKPYEQLKFNEKAEKRG